MSTMIPSPLLLLLLLLSIAFAHCIISHSSPEPEPIGSVRAALDALANARSRASAFSGFGAQESSEEGREGISAWADCAQLYEDSEQRVRRLLAGGGDNVDDARTWLSAALTSHGTCADGLWEANISVPTRGEQRAVRVVLVKALAAYGLNARSGHETNTEASYWNSTSLNSKLLTMWDASNGNADMVVAQDGSGNYKTIGEAVSALKYQARGDRRLVIYVKSGIYFENVEVGRNMKNVMFVGDGIDKTVVTGSRSVPDGYTTFRSATFGVSGDGFWARDMTFENTAGPAKHQAVALMAASDCSVFYRCSFKGYQDTLFVHSQRQFYRDCHIYGTVDFIFGNAAVVLQNCDIFVQKPMSHQSNMITAQGREDPNQNTGISVHSSRVRPTQDLEPVKGSFHTYLGRPWQKYSRTVFLKTDLDGLVNPEGWAKWRGNFALDTLYYGEYMNTGDGAATGERVSWPGFHVMRDADEAAPFTVESFIQGNSWIPETGIPYWSGL